MKKVSLVVSSKVFENGEVFNQHSPYNRDETFHLLRVVKSEFKKFGYEVFTHDQCPPGEADITIFSNVPKELDSVPKNSVVILGECSVIKPQNFDLDCHSKFSKIFTWSDKLVDEIRYFKFNHASYFANYENHHQKQKLCALIAANKKVVHPIELYSKRIEAIKWFEENYPKDLDLYGFGWNQGVSTSRALNLVLRRWVYASKLFAKLNGELFSVYRGSVTQKYKTLSPYKFSICFENALGISGYITEKIFDSFFAGCVPIYLGADDVANHIPSSCFIDFRNFEGYAGLYDYISNMSEAEHLTYQERIREFLRSDASAPFSSRVLGKKLVYNILEMPVTELSHNWGET